MPEEPITKELPSQGQRERAKLFHAATLLRNQKTFPYRRPRRNEDLAPGERKERINAPTVDAANAQTGDPSLQQEHQQPLSKEKLKERQENIVAASLQLGRYLTSPETTALMTGRLSVDEIVQAAEAADPSQGTTGEFPSVNDVPSTNLSVKPHEARTEVHPDLIKKYSVEAAVALIKKYHKVQGLSPQVSAAIEELAGQKKSSVEIAADENIKKLLNEKFQDNSNLNFSEMTERPKGYKGRHRMMKPPKRSVA